MVSQYIALIFDEGKISYRNKCCGELVDICDVYEHTYIITCLLLANFYDQCAIFNLRILMCIILCSECIWRSNNSSCHYIEHLEMVGFKV